MSNIPDTFNLVVYDESGELFSGPVAAIEAVNEAGPFSVLSGHTNLLSVISGSLDNNKLVIHFLDGNMREFIIQQGVLKIFENAAEIFLVFET